MRLSLLALLLLSPGCQCRGELPNGAATSKSQDTVSSVPNTTSSEKQEPQDATATEQEMKAFVLGEDQPSTNPQPPLPNDIPGLIETLASPNRPAKGGHGEPHYPSGFDHAAQGRVLAARQALRAKGVAAFPYLIKRLSDSRYSETVAYAVWVNLQVGDVCEQIIEAQVLSRHTGNYKSREGADGKKYSPPCYFYSLGGIEKWWSTHSTKNLLEMKVEALKWTIEQEEKIGFPTPGDRKLYLEPLQTELRQLQSQQEKRLSNTE
jgi:hypothetical protein